MYDFPVHDLLSGTKRKSTLFFHRSTRQMATSTILTWRHTSPLYKPFTCICVLKPFRPQYPQTDTSIKHFPLGEHFINSLFLSIYRKLMMSPLTMFLTSGELVTTYDRKGSGDRLEGQLNMADSYAVKTDLGLKKKDWQPDIPSAQVSAERALGVSWFVNTGNCGFKVWVTALSFIYLPMHRVITEKQDSNYTWAGALSNPFRLYEESCWISLRQWFYF